MTNERYLKDAGWTRDVGSILFCWRSPRNRKALKTEAQAMAEQATHDKEANAKKQN